MLTIQCTKKLADELKINVVKVKPLVLNPLYAWHAHLFFIQRHKCVLVMNNHTRYNFLMYGLKKADFNNFDNIVIDAIRENLLFDGNDESIVEKYMQGCGQVIYTATSDRSVVGQINEMRFAIEYHFEDDRVDGKETDISELNRWLNKFIMSKLSLGYSGETMKLALLEI